MSQNIPLAVLLGLAGSLCFAIAAKVQHRAVRGQVEGNRAKKRMNLAQLWRLIRDRNWLFGLGLLAVSELCLIMALWMAPVSVVQPVGLLAFPWSVILAMRSRGAYPMRIIAPTVVTVLATVAFVLIVSVYASPPPKDLDLVPVVAGAGAVYAVCAVFAVIGSRGQKQWRCLFWASGGAAFYGLESALVKSLFEFASAHEWWSSPIVWATVAALVVGSALGAVMVQQGYATGPTEVVVASMTVTSPVVAVVFGIAVLAEGSHLTWLPGLSLVLLGGVAVAGVVVLTQVSHRHADSVPHTPHDAARQGTRPVQ